MKFTGMNRPIDELGRIVIPKEIRNALEIKPKDNMEIYINDGTIVLKKVDNSCVLCGRTEDINYFDDKCICSSCIERIKIMAE